MNIKLIRAFIASPGGLDAERQAAFQAAEEVNRSVAIPLGGRLELYGWEETLSGSGRPQAIINAEMETCDLFIGAIWTRWGSQPANGGKYTSGFEEEFELSRDRFTRTNSPIMAMFFKDIEELQLRDPGDDLKKVLKFKDSLTAEKSFLYNNFATPQDFAAKVRQFLSSHTIRLLRDETVLREDQPAQPAVSDHTDRPLLATASSEGAAPGFLASAAEGMEGGNDLKAQDVARLRLIGNTAETEGNDPQLLGVHDANLLYLHRKSYDFSPREIDGLLATGIVELPHENTPIWFWLAERLKADPSYVEALTLFGSDERRAGALRILQLFGRPFGDLEYVQSLTIGTLWFENKVAGSVRVAALRYLRDYGTAAEIPAITEEAERADKDSLAPAQEAIVAILLREDAPEAARFLLSASFDSFDKPLLFQALRHLEKLTNDKLYVGLDHRSPEIRSRVLTLLSKRGDLLIDTIFRAKDDDAAIVRLAGLRASERIGQPPSIGEARKILTLAKRTSFSFLRGTEPSGERLFNLYRAERLRHMSPAALEALLDVADDRDAAYQMLAEKRVGDYGASIRADLRDRFAKYFRAHWPDGMPQQPTGALSQLMLGTSDPDAAKRRDLVYAAVDIVAEQREAADLPLIREVVDKEIANPTPTVVAFFKLFGERSDALRIAKCPLFPHVLPDDNDYYGTHRSAARLMLKLYKGAFAELIKLDMPDDMRARLIELCPSVDFATLDDADILALLLSGTDNVRRATARKTPASVTRTRVRKILAAYRAHPEGRFYIVAHWLDLGLAFNRSEARQIISVA